jgi:hypothetical protein
LSNEEAMRQAFYGRCTEWGEKAGAGDTSRVGFNMDLAATSWDPNSPIGKGDKAATRAEATTAYEAWRNARIRKAGEMGKRIASDDGASRVNRISEVIKYLTVGALPLIHDADMGGFGTLKRALKIIREREDIKGEVEDLLSKVATAQKKAPDRKLTDDDIADVIEPAVTKPELTDEEKRAQRWANIRTQIDAVMKAFKEEAENVDAKTARAIADKQVRDLGGTVAEKAKALADAEREAKKKAKAAKAKAKRRK